MPGQGSGGNVLAAICSFLIPGLGQLVQGRLFAAVLFLVLTIAGFMVFIVPGVLVWLAAVIEAAVWKPRRVTA